MIIINNKSSLKINWRIRKIMMNRLNRIKNRLQPILRLFKIFKTRKIRIFKRITNNTKTLLIQKNFRYLITKFDKLIQISY